MSLLTSDYIASWFFLQKKDFTGLSQILQPYYVLESLDYSKNVGTEAVDLIQGDAGVHVINTSETTFKTTISSEALIIKDVDTTTVQYRDIFDIFLEDYYALLNYFFIPSTDLNNNGGNSNDLFSGNKVRIENLFNNATITIGQKISCNIDYNCVYSNKFNVAYNNYSEGLQGDFDFIARTARNYDCRFFIDNTNDYYIKSGSLTISMSHKQVYIANTKNSVPFYSPQGYKVTGSITVLVKNFDFENIPTYGNISLLVGDRYLELGQASIKSEYNRKLNASESASTMTIQFTGYARLGAGINNSTWLTYFQSKLDQEKFTKVLQKINGYLS